MTIERKGYLRTKRRIDFIVQSFKIQNNNLYEPIKFLLILYCEDPYFYDTDEMVFTYAKKRPMFHFPIINNPKHKQIMDLQKSSDMIAVYNETAFNIGGQIRLIALKTIPYPSITNLNTNQKIGLELTMWQGDTLVIDTTKQAPTVQMNGKNVKSAVMLDSEFFKFGPGKTILQIGIFTDVAPPDLVDVSVKTKSLYLGV